MNTDDYIDLLIYSLDNDLDDFQQQQLTTALAASADLRLEKKRLLKIRGIVGQLTVEAAPLFVDEVMTAIHQTTVKVEAKIIALFPRVAAASVAFFILAYMIVALMDTSFTTDMLVGVEDLTPEDAYSLLD